jgi:RNA polymerase sigma-B factor
MPRIGGSQDRRAREERALFARLARDGDAHARDLLIQRFLPLARSLALRYRRSGEPLDDLLQVASLGLIKAIDRFDLDRKMQFSTYAVPTILGEIKRYFRDRTWAVHVPRPLQELTLRVECAVGDLVEELCRQPSVAEITAAVGAKEANVLEALQAGGAHRALSFDAPGGTDENVFTLADSIGIDEHGFDRAEERATLAALLGMVTSREREVLRLRFEQDMTQSEIGAVIGVGQMQVSRIIRQALERIRLATALRAAAGCHSSYAPPAGAEGGGRRLAAPFG